MVTAKKLVNSLMGCLGILIGLTLMLSAFEPIGIGIQSLNFQANTAWSIWMVLLAVMIANSGRLNLQIAANSNLNDPGK